MCWNAPVSLITWVTSIIGCILLIRRGKKVDIWNAMFALTFGSMQLWEFFMWIDTKCKGLNQTATKIALFSLWAQPLLNCIGWFLYSENKFILIPIVIYSLILLITSINIGLSKGNWCSKPSRKCGGSLLWAFQKKNKLISNWNNLRTINFGVFLYMCGLIIPLFFQKPIWKGCVLVGVNLLSLILVSLFYSSKFSSMWCWTVNIYVWVAYGLYYN